jgi:hypothetical protein
MRFTQVTNVSDGDGPAVAVITDASVANIEKSAAIVTLELSNLETALSILRLLFNGKSMHAQ